MESQKRKKLMETKADVTVQRDEATKVLRDKVLSISLVTDCIFNHMPFSDLLSNCSVVSKKWDSTVKDYIRRRRTCLFKCNLDDVNELENQTQILKNQSMKNSCLMFSGLVLIIGPKATKKKQRQSLLKKSILRDLFSLIEPTHIVLRLNDKEGDIPWRRQYLHQEFHSGSDKLISNVLFRLLPAYKIKHLSFNVKLNDFTFHWDLWLKNVEPGGFATLETIKPYERRFNWTVSVNGCQALLRTCPNIKSMPMELPVEAVMIFDQYSKLPLVNHLSLNPRNGGIRLRTECCNALRKLSDDSLLTIDLNECCEWTPGEFQWIGRILKLHSNSLKRISLQFAVRPLDLRPVGTSNYENIFQLNFPPLPFVKKVTLMYELGEPLGPQDTNLSIGNHPHLKRIFPNARIVALLGGDNIFKRPIFDLTCSSEDSYSWM